MGLRRQLIDTGVEDKYDIANLIFHSGLSTSVEVSKISGRGIGMDAIKTYLQESGGGIGLELTEGLQEGFSNVAFVITLSRDSFRWRET